MHSKTKLEFQFSKNIEEIRPATQEAFKKGMKQIKKDLELKNLEIKKDRAKFTLEGKRCHTKIIRLKNFLQQELGPEHHVGVRKINVIDYEIKFKPEKPAKKPIEMPFVKKMEKEGQKLHLWLENLDEDDLEKSIPDRILKRLEKRIAQQHIQGKKEFSETIKKSNPRTKKYALQEDPTKELEERNWVQRTGRGVWTILPPYAALWKAINKLVTEKITQELKFQETILPKLVPLDTHRKKGQLSGVPNEIWWVCPPETRDPEEWNNYKDYVAITHDTAPEKLKQKLGKPKFGLAYAQCEPFYEIWSKKTIDRDKTPLKFVDQNGPTWRYEAGGLKGLERLNEFNRIEYIYLGSPEKVIDIRNQLKDKALEIVDEVFDLEWELQSTTAAYLEHSGETQETETEEPRTYDINANIPFKAKSKPEKHLEIASFHIHEDYYAQKFSWKERKNRKLWSGCTGISPTRWAYVLLIRHGFNPKNWPEEIKKRVRGKLPELPEDLFM